MNDVPVEIVSATRMSEQEFWQRSALGVSLRRLAVNDRISFHVAFANRRGLSTIYNERIRADNANQRLVFMHDDVWIDDYFFVDRIVAALKDYDVVGVAGNKRRIERQPAWAFINDCFTWDDRSHLSGAVAHGANPFGAVTVFGPTPAECELLDGVLIAANRDALLRGKVQFDERFDFHFYDMDFCRSARAAGLRLGTWPICITHQSGGGFGSPAWRARYADYLGKWEGPDAPLATARGASDT